MGGSPVNAGSLVGDRLGKYDMLALLAIGGTAEIYLARIGGEAGFQKYVVVKCLLDHLADDAEFVRMFLDEARLGAQLHHSNIVQTLELGQHNGRYYMVMEFLAGMSLAQMARKTQERVEGGVIPVDLVLGLAAQACSGLHYAHNRSASDGSALNIVHRDVSPQNLVVSFEGVLKIVDFGIAKADQRQTQTRTGTIKGKFAYMSPEQCMAEPIDRRTDIFALGTIVHELLTARRLFKRQSTYDTYQAIIKGNVPPPSALNPDLGPEIDEVVMKALTYDKRDRYDSAETFGEALLGTLHRRGRAVNSGEVSRFFDAYFGPELEEHGNRMRELVSGQHFTKSVDLSWDAEADAEDASSSISSSSQIGGPTETEEDEDGVFDARGIDAERQGEFGGDTHIELNPADKIAKMHFDDDPMTGPTNLRQQAAKPAGAARLPGVVPRPGDGKKPAGQAAQRASGGKLGPGSSALPPRSLTAATAAIAPRSASRSPTAPPVSSTPAEALLTSPTVALAPRGPSSPPPRAATAPPRAATAPTQIEVPTDTIARGASPGPTRTEPALPVGDETVAGHGLGRRGGEPIEPGLATAETMAVPFAVVAAVAAAGPSGAHSAVAPLAAGAGGEPFPPPMPTHPGGALLDVYNTPAPSVPPWLDPAAAAAAAEHAHAMGQHEQGVQPMYAGSERYVEPYRPGPRPTQLLRAPRWHLAVAYVIGAGVGMGLTILVVKLIG